MTEPSTIAQRLDHMPLTRSHLLVLVLCGFGLAFDLYEIGLGSAFGAIFSAPPHSASASALSWLLSSVYIGAILGASAGGWLADKVGRRAVMIAMLWLLAATAAIAAASPNLYWLTAARIVMGLTLGAFPPLITAYLTDILPIANRGRLIFTTMAFAFLGAPVGVFLIRTMTPLEFLGTAGWRWSLVFGAAGAAASALAFLRLPESPRWLSAMGRNDEALAALQGLEKSPHLSSPRHVAAAAQTPEGGTGATLEPVRIRFAKLAALCFFSPWSTTAFPLLMGAILAQKGFQLSDTLFYVGLSAFGPVIGTLAAAFAIDRFERRASLAACALAMLASGLLFTYSNDPGWLVLTSLAFSMCSAVYVPMLNVYGAELFATRVRASAVTGAWAFNRLGAALAPMLLVPFLRTAGPQTMMAAIAVTLLASLGLLYLSAAGRSRLAVD